MYIIYTPLDKFPATLYTCKGVDEGGGGGGFSPTPTPRFCRISTGHGRDIRQRKIRSPPPPQCELLSTPLTSRYIPSNSCAHLPTTFYIFCLGMSRCQSTIKISFISSPGAKQPSHFTRRHVQEIPPWDLRFQRGGHSYQWHSQSPTAGCPAKRGRRAKEEHESVIND